MAESDCGSAERYEFDAPSHVVDLKELENNDGDDQWFEQQVGGADGRLTTPLRPDWPSMRSNTPNLLTAIVIPQVKTDVDTGPGPSTSPPPNLVTSWGAETATQAHGRPKRRTVNQPPAQPRRISIHKVTTTSSAPTQSAAPPAKKSKLSPVARPARRSSGVCRRNSRASLLSRVQTNSRNPPKTGTAASKAALAGSQAPKKAALSTTVPNESNLHTDHSIKATTSSSTARKGATVPKPFNLSMGRKRKVEGSGAYVPMAQQIEQYQKRTPDRYHLRSRQSQERGPHPVKGDQLKLTHPHTPHLMTRQRSRPTTVKSSAELEAEEVDQLHNFKFKALELNRKLLEGAEHLKKPAVKEPTVPEGFELFEKRLQERQISKHSEEEERPHTFKAQPLPKRILEGVMGVPERKVLHPTVPESPAFALKKRVRVNRKVEEVKQPSPIKPPPVPHFGLPFQPRLPEHHHVEVCPFSFDERERERRAMKEKRLEEKRNEEVPQFKAQPLPDFESVLLPEKKKLEATKPEPFRLLLDERGSVKNSRREQMVKEEQKQQEEAATFKARPNTVTHKEPFQPKKPERAAAVSHSSTAVENFELSTERRARERQEYERLVSEKEALRDLMEEEQKREEEQQQKEEITRMRQEQVHKAQPVKHYKPVLVKKSEVPLTVPHSPNFSDRFRL